MEEIEYPIRINRYLFLKGHCSRREADRLIEKKQIRINGKMALIGQKVEKGDKVEISKEVEKIAQNRVYLAFNKPRGIVTHDPVEGQTSISDILCKECTKLSAVRGGEENFSNYSQGVPLPRSTTGRTTPARNLENFQKPTKKCANFVHSVFPMGRLDKESEGLIILTNDGRITNALLSPDHEHEKEYIVEVNHRIDLNFIRAMENGVNIGGYRTKPSQIKKTEPKKFHIILTEGKKHQIRRMCSALNQEVEGLKRIRIMNIKLGKIKSGQYKEIFGTELEEFLSALKIR